MTYANVERLTEFVNGIIRKSKSGDLRWEPSGAADLRLRGMVGSVIVSSVDGDGQRPYRLLILDSDDTILDTFQLDPDQFSVMEDELDDRIADLYQIARQSAFPVNQVIDELTQEFDL